MKDYSESSGGITVHNSLPVASAQVVSGLRSKIVFCQTLTVQRPGLLQRYDSCLWIHLQPAKQDVNKVWQIGGCDGGEGGSQGKEKFFTLGEGRGLTVSEDD